MALHVYSIESRLYVYSIESGHIRIHHREYTYMTDSEYTYMTDSEYTYMTDNE